MECRVKLDPSGGPCGCMAAAGRAVEREDDAEKLVRPDAMGQGMLECVSSRRRAAANHSPGTATCTRVNGFFCCFCGCGSFSVVLCGVLGGWVCLVWNRGRNKNEKVEKFFVFCLF